MRQESHQLLLLLCLLLFQHLLLLELQMLLGMLLLIQKGSSAGLDARRSLLHRGMADIRNGTAHIGYCSVLSIRHCLRCLPRFGACLHLASSIAPM